MSKLNLDSLNQLAGFVGAALVDGDSGMAMVFTGGGSLNLEVAAAGNSDVLRTKRRVSQQLDLDDTIEDILISLGKQYHLIRPLAKASDLFAYYVLDKSKANLALARRKLAEVGDALEV